MKIMRSIYFHRIFFILWLQIFWLICPSQDFLYFGLSNYGGVMPVILNPSSIADSRSESDLFLSGVQADIKNNYLALRSSLFKGQGFLANSKDTAFKEKYFARNMNGLPKSLYMNHRAMLPSFMATLNEKSSIAFTWSIRSLMNAYNVSQQLSDVLFSNLYDKTLYTPEKNYNLALAFNTFAEYGLSYARVLFQEKKHFLKAGLTLKLLQGLGSIYAHANPFHYQVTSDSTMNIYNSQISYGHSNNFELSTDWLLDYQFYSLPGFGSDFGLTYEFRPHYEKYSFLSKKGERIQLRNRNKYFIKFSASLLDLGHINYGKSADSRDFFANTTSFNVRKLKMNDKFIHNLDDTIRKRFVLNNTSERYKMYLPARILLQSDIRLSDLFYFNISSVLNIRKTFQFTNRCINEHHFSIRFERKNIGGVLSLNYNKMLADVGQPWSLGAMAHFFFLSFGTMNLNSLLLQRDIYGVNFFVLIKTSPVFFKRPPDKDSDGIPDEADVCPDLAGNEKTNGCPDSDFDGVPDKDDLCPDASGMLVFQGCPDSDNDTVPDPSDECPKEVGSKFTKGCPDKDKDGLADKYDACPDVQGIIPCNGCPFLQFEGVILNTYQTTDITKDKIKVFLLDSLFHRIDSTTSDENGKFFFPCVTGKYHHFKIMLDNSNPKVIRKARFYLLDPTDQQIKRATTNSGNYSYVFDLLPFTRFDWTDLKGSGNLALAAILVNASDNKPLSHKKIFIRNEQGDIMDSVTTNHLGSFAFKFLDADQSYMIYLDETDPSLQANMKIILTSKEGKEIRHLFYNPSLKRFELKLLPAELASLKELQAEDAILSFDLRGTLTDVKKNPLGNVKLSVYSDENKKNLLIPIITDEKGNFKMNNLKLHQAKYFTIEEDNPRLKDLLVILVLDKFGRVVKKILRGTDGSFSFKLFEVEKTSLIEYYIDDPWLGIQEPRKKEITVVENIIYPSNEFRVPKEGERILAKVASALIENPEFMVEIGSHTDSRAGDAYNLKLSQKRAQYVVDYLIRQGVDKSRLKAVGYGETRILNHCKNNVKCSDAENAINRRTEFKLKRISE